MPLRKADSIYKAATGRKFGVPDLEFIMDQLVRFGKARPGTAHYQRVKDTLGWVTTLNARLPRPFDDWFLIFQTWHETGGYTSDYFVRDGNLAGIGIWASGIPSPWEGQLGPEMAAKVYLLEVMYKTYTLEEMNTFGRTDVGKEFSLAAQKDAKHLAKVIDLRESTDWPTIKRIEQLNDRVGQWDYIWAQDPLYPEKIEGLAADVAPNLPDAKGVDVAVNIGNRPIRIAVGAGHRNNSGGNEFETTLNAKVTNEFVKLCRKSDGFDVRCYTPDDGLGWFNGPLDAAARTVVTWLNQGWAADHLQEIHHEGLGDSSVHGGHYIYPDSAGLVGRNPGNIDLDVKAEAGPMAKIMVASYGGVCRYSGCNRGMSEKETGVGSDGFRLGVFGAWAEPYFNENSFQTISESATYTNPTDLAIMKRSDYPANVARGMLEAVAHLAKVRGNWTYKYTIGTKPDVPPTGPVAPDGLPYPEGLDEGIISRAFGKVRSFNPKGVVSRAWYSRSKERDTYPPLVSVFTSPEGRDYYFFGDGSILWRPNNKSAYRWIV